MKRLVMAILLLSLLINNVIGADYKGMVEKVLEYDEDVDVEDNSITYTTTEEILLQAEHYEVDADINYPSEYNATRYEEQANKSKVQEIEATYELIDDVNESNTITATVTRQPIKTEYFIIAGLFFVMIFFMILIIRQRRKKLVSPEELAKQLYAKGYSDDYVERAYLKQKELVGGKDFRKNPKSERSAEQKNVFPR